jgi:hypothetical protein
MILSMLNYLLLIAIGAIPAMLSLIDMIFPWPFAVYMSIKMQEQDHTKLLTRLDDKFAHTSFAVELCAFLQGIIFVCWFFIAQYNIK